VQNLEASISLCDPMNPGFGYQIRIVRAAPPGAPVDVLFTSRDPVTGKDRRVQRHRAVRLEDPSGERLMSVTSTKTAAPELSNAASAEPEVRS
jgi:hypothetical protein